MQDGAKEPRFRVKDLYHDGRDELLISPSWGGTGGDTWCVWRTSGQSAQFRDMGEIFGKSIGRAPSGLMATDAAGSAATRVITFFRFGDTKIENLAAVRFDAPGPASPPPWTCALGQDQSGLALLGLDPATAERRFCQEAREVDWQ